MAVFNTTYNFNQGNMNFGQSLLYGAFGSLTGGGCMGMNGSLFSMMGMGGYGYGGFGYGGYMSDQMVGMQIGNMLSGVLYGCVTHAFEGRGGNDGGESLSSKISTVKSNANKHLDILNENGNTYSLDNNDFKNATINDEPKYQDNIDAAQSKYDEANKKVTPLEGEINGLKTEIKNLKADSKFNKPVQKDGQSDTDYQRAVTEWQEYCNKVSALETQLNEKETELKKLQDSLKETGELGKALKEAKEAKSTRESEINNAIKALKPIKDEYDELIKEQNSESLNELLNKADGNSLSRMRKSDEGKAQTALFGFRKAQEKWNKGDHSDTVKNQLKSAYKNVQDNKAGISSKYESILDSIDSWITQEKLEEIKD